MYYTQRTTERHTCTYIYKYTHVHVYTHYIYVHVLQTCTCMRILYVVYMYDTIYLLMYKLIVL